MSISRPQRLKIIIAAVAISLAICTNKFMVLLPEAMLTQSDRQVIGSAKAICDRDGYAKCYKISNEKCKIQMGIAARVCLRQPLHDCEEGEPVESRRECYGEINECILVKHLATNALSGIKEAVCVGNVLNEPFIESP